MSFAQKMGKFADKVVTLTEKATKKIGDYAEKSATENENKNAQKLSDFMKSVTQKIEDNHENYVSRVTENAENILKNGQESIDSIKSNIKDMKTRVNIAKEKVKKDISQKDCDTHK